MAVLRRQAPPPGIPPDPAYYTWSIQRQLTAIDLSLMILALLAVLARVYIRVFVLRVFRLDDYFIVVAMLCSILACSIFLWVVHLGMGKHFFALPPENVEPLLMWIFIVSILIPLALCFVKLSIAFFLLSLLQRTHYRRFLWGIIAFLVIFILFTFFTIVFSCIPTSANWNFALRPPPIGHGTAKCFSVTTYRNIALVNSATNIFTDIVLAVMPIPLVWTLQVNKRTKASLIFILSLGFFACAAGIVKTPLLYHFFDNMDSTGNKSWYYAWQMAEMNVGIIAATLPSLNRAFRWLLRTAKNIATGASHNSRSRSLRYGPGGVGGGVVGNTANRRKFSSGGYIPQKDIHGLGSGGGGRGGAYSYGYGGKRSKGLGLGGSNKSELNDNDMFDLEMHDLDGLKPYNVTVARDESVPDGGSAGRGGSNSSSDTILRVGGEAVERDGSRSPDPRRGLRGIVRTTKVTIVTT